MSHQERGVRLLLSLSKHIHSTVTHFHTCSTCINSGLAMWGLHWNTHFLFYSHNRRRPDSTAAGNWRVVSVWVMHIDCVCVSAVTEGADPSCMASFCLVICLCNQGDANVVTQPRTVTGCSMSHSNLRPQWWLTGRKTDRIKNWGWM